MREVLAPRTDARREHGRAIAARRIDSEDRPRRSREDRAVACDSDQAREIGPRSHAVARDDDAIAGDRIDAHDRGVFRVQREERTVRWGDQLGETSEIGPGTDPGTGNDDALLLDRIDRRDRGRGRLATGDRHVDRAAGCDGHVGVIVEARAEIGAREHREQILDHPALGIETAETRDALDEGGRPLVEEYDVAARLDCETRSVQDAELGAIARTRIDSEKRAIREPCEAVAHVEVGCGRGDGFVRQDLDRSGSEIEPVDSPRRTVHGKDPAVLVGRPRSVGAGSSQASGAKARTVPSAKRTTRSPGTSVA